MYPATDIFGANTSSPTPTAWSHAPWSAGDTAMDLETSVHLRCHLSRAFSAARQWSDLIEHLGILGFHLAFRDGRLTLVNDQTQMALCSCRFLGFSVADLRRTLGKPCVLAGSGRLVARPVS